MGELRVVGAAAVAVGTDILKGNEFAKVPYPRLIQTRMMTGGATIGAVQIELYVGRLSVADLVNSALGEGSRNTDLYGLEAYVPANVAVRAVIRVSPTTNPVILKLAWKP